MTLCTIIRGKGEIIGDFIIRVKEVERLVIQITDKVPLIKFHYTSDGTTILWADFRLPEGG